MPHEASDPTLHNSSFLIFSTCSLYCGGSSTAMQCFGRLCKKRSKQLDVPSDHDLALNQQDAVEVRSYETFRVRFAADIATFSGEDGSKIDVPLYALHRSTQLTDVFGCTTDTSTSGIRIVLPTGVLHSWICSLHDLRLLKEDVARPAKHGSRGENGLVSESIPLIKVRSSFLSNVDVLFLRVSCGLAKHKWSELPNIREPPMSVSADLTQRREQRKHNRRRSMSRTVLRQIPIITHDVGSCDSMCFR